jgi:hypothetical protein
MAGRPARVDPWSAKLGQAVAHVVPLWAAGVVKTNGWLTAAEGDLAHRDFE